MTTLLIHPVERDRYSEQWSADVAGCRELGIAPWAVVLGSLRTAASARLHESSRLGAPPLLRGVRLLRWALSALFLVPVLGIAVWWAGALTASWLPFSLLAVIWVAGMVAAVRALHVARLPLGYAALGLVPLALLGFVVSPLLLGAILLPATAVGMGSFIVWANRLEGIPPRFATRARRTTAAAASFAMVVLTAAVGLLDGLVWMPLAITDDSYTLGEVYAALSPADRNAGVTVLVVWASIGVTLALVLLTLAASARGTLALFLTPKRVMLLGVLLSGLGLLSAPWAAFSIGMNVSDTVPPFTGGQSAVGGAIMASGIAALGLVVLLTLPPGRVRPSIQWDPALSAR